MQVETVTVAGGSWLRASICAQPTGAGLAQAAALAYNAARSGPFGLAIDERGHLVVATWIDGQARMDRSELGDRMHALATAWQRALDGAASPRKPLRRNTLESRIRDELFRAI
jgi:hypothetical protein